MNIQLKSILDIIETNKTPKIEEVALTQYVDAAENKIFSSVDENEQLQENVFERLDSVSVKSEIIKDIEPSVSDQNDESKQVVGEFEFVEFKCEPSEFEVEDGNVESTQVEQQVKRDEIAIATMSYSEPVRYVKCPIEACRQDINQRYFKQHLITDHKINGARLKNIKFGCEYCMKTFHRNYDLQRHRLEVHIKPFTCSVCSSGFGQVARLKRHVQKHQN